MSYHIFNDVVIHDWMQRNIV